jgi:hypothetical protein
MEGQELKEELRISFNKHLLIVIKGLILALEESNSLLRILIWFHNYSLDSMGFLDKVKLRIK